MASIVTRILPLSTFHVKPHFSCLSIRFKHNHPYETPGWEHLQRREDVQGKKCFISYPDKERWDFYNEVKISFSHFSFGLINFLTF